MTTVLAIILQLLTISYGNYYFRRDIFNYQICFHGYNRYIIKIITYAIVTDIIYTFMINITLVQFVPCNESCLITFVSKNNLYQYLIYL